MDKANVPLVKVINKSCDARILDVSHVCNNRVEFCENGSIAFIILHTSAFRPSCPKNSFQLSPSSVICQPSSCFLNTTTELELLSEEEWLIKNNTMRKLEEILMS